MAHPLLLAEDTADHEQRCMGDEDREYSYQGDTLIQHGRRALHWNAYAYSVRFESGRAIRTKNE
jgi:hypothetical protein